jgi:NADPH:quinone reductase-like Zn-dependent oxidoreductase
MQAVVYRHHGRPGVLRIEQVPEPVPRCGQILVRVRAAALNSKDLYLLRGKPRWLRLLGGSPPHRVGFDLAGELMDGRRVFGMLDGFTGGALAEWVAVPETNLAPIPDDLGFPEAAALPLVALTALQGLRDHGLLNPGARVLVHGASGGVGTMAIQIAKALGGHVTTASSSGNRDLCRSLGADATLDYTSDPVPPPGERFDVILDAAGKLRFGICRPFLAKHGRFVSTVPSLDMLRAMALSRFSRRRAALVAVRCRPADLAWLVRAAQQGQVRPVLDRVYPLAQVVPAMERLETRRSRGKIVVEL